MEGAVDQDHQIQDAEVACAGQSCIGHRRDPKIVERDGCRWPRVSADPQLGPAYPRGRLVERHEDRQIVGRRREPEVVKPHGGQPGENGRTGKNICPCRQLGSPPGVTVEPRWHVHAVPDPLPGRTPPPRLSRTSSAGDRSRCVAVEDRRCVLEGLAFDIDEIHGAQHPCDHRHPWSTAIESGRKWQVKARSGCHLRPLVCGTVSESALSVRGVGETSCSSRRRQSWRPTTSPRCTTPRRCPGRR
jgi:hypothetical protein